MDFFETGDDGGGFFWGEYSYEGGGFGVGDGAANVLCPHAVVVVVVVDSIRQVGQKRCRYGA